jgi:calcineurin-like phosphoesterase family protein
MREFKSLERMNSTLVDNINEYVAQDDILIHLGDWSFGGFEKIQEFRDKIVCKNIHLITGNHDHHIQKNREDCQSLFSSVNKYVELNVKWRVGTPLAGEQNFVLMHFPIASWNDMARGTIHLHGHVHLEPNKRIGNGKMMDVGVDGNNLYPISLAEVITLMDKQPIKSMLTFDHHEIVENYK